MAWNQDGILTTISSLLSGGSSSTTISPVGGSKTVTTAGTGVPLVATATTCHMLYVRAKTANTNTIYVGDYAVDKTSSKQIMLSPGNALTINADTGMLLNVAQWYIDSEVNGEGVDFLYL